MKNEHQIYLISDSTGETLDRIFLALKAQFTNFEYELKSGNLRNLGEILHENWMLKKDLSTIISKYE